MDYSTKLFALVMVAITFAGCSGSKTVTSNENPEETSDSSAPAKALGATNTWHLSTADANPYYGTGVQRAYEELLRDKKAREKVIVAIIDSGTDIHHEDLKANIWRNEDEIAGNGIDDDQNGYVDDLHGWNFIGGPDSTHVNKDTYELTRLYAKYREQFGEIPADSVSDDQMEDYEYYQEIREAYQKRVESNQRNIQQVNQTRQAILFAKQTLNITNIDSVSLDDMQLTGSEDPREQQAKQIITAIKSNGAKESDVKDLEEYYQHLVDLSQYGLNPDYDPREIVGDDYEDLTNRYYGNNDVKGPRSDHGTHVAGIVGAVRDNGLGAQGIAGSVELMIVRTVPDGDERDKDVANAIRYAAENGARVINMSFGKGYSPQKEYVDAAIRFADSLGVLMVSGAGNGSDNIDSTASFPTRNFENGRQATNFLSVGATSWRPDSMMVADFSNYGKGSVDLFAPGVDIYSTYPENEYKMESGTSMASPVVAGIAALVMSYYPELETQEVKEILLESVTPVEQVIYQPGSREQTLSFSQLSQTGGIINAYQALKLAEERSNR